MSRLFGFLAFTVIVTLLLSCGGGGRKTITPPIPPPDTGNKTVSGSVTDSNGNPVPGLTVLLDGQKTSVKTGVNGEYLLGEDFFNQGSSANYRLSLGLGGIIFAEEAVSPASTANADFEFGSPGGETGKLSGTVFDSETDEGLDGAVVIAFSYSGGLFFDETEAGTYQMELPAGYWLLLGWLEGYNPGVSTVEVQGGGESVQDIYLTPVGAPTQPAGMIVSGTITDKGTGAPVAGAFVTMSVDTGYLGMPVETGTVPPDDTEPPAEGGGSGDSGGGTVEPATPSQTDSKPPESDMGYGMPYLPSYQETTTDASGHYEFTDGVVGYSAYFTVNADGYLPGNEWTELPQSGDSFVKDMEIQPLVFTSVSGSCIDENGDPVPNAWVEFIFQGGMGGGWAMPMMDATFMGGMVDDANAAAEDFADREGGMPMGGAAPPNAGEGGGNNDFDNPTFMKFLEEQRSNRNSSQEMPPDYFTGYYSVQADENGNFSIESVAVGPYYVFADAYRHLPFDAQLEMLPDVENEVEVLLENTPVGSVEGDVVDENGDPIEDALVNCVQPNRDPFTFTDANGHYRIDNIPASQGEWDMWIVGAYAVGYAAKGVEVAILEDDVLNIDFTLETYTPPTVDTVYFTGTVIDGTTGEPVPDARLYVVSRDNQYWEDGVTDSKGVFTMNLVPTEYAIDIDAESQGYQNLYTWFWVDPGYPQMEFYLWPIDSNGTGGWGGIEVPGDPLPPESDGGGETRPGGEGDFSGPLPL